MQKTKKILCVLLTAVLLMSVFMMPSSALLTENAPAAANIAIDIKAFDENGNPVTSLTPGQTITFKLWVDAKKDTARLAGGMFLIFYDTNIFDYVADSRTWLNHWYNVVDDTSLYNVNDTTRDTPTNNTFAKLTEEELAYGWTSTLNIQITNVAGTTYKNGTLLKANSADPVMSFQLTVADTVTPGTESVVGIPTTAIAPLNTTRQNYTYLQTWENPAANTITQNKTKASYFTDMLVTFGAPVAAGPALAKSNSQVKFYGTQPTADDNFDYRLVSKVTDADWDTYFANTGAAIGNNRITSVGFVAHDKKDGAMNLDTAKAVAKGTPSAGYQTASTTYISKANDTADATFGCLIKDILHSTQANDIECLAFVQYVDGTGATQYIFYDAAINAAVNTGYANALAAWKAA